MTAALGFGAAIVASGLLLSSAVATAHRDRLLARVRVRPAATGVARVTFSRPLGTAVGVLVLALIGERLAGPVGAVAGAASVPAGIRAMRRRRRELQAIEAERQLHEAVLAMAAAVRAGMSIRLAVAEARRDAEDPLAGELEHASRALDVGRPLDEVLEQLGDRIGVADARLVAGALRVHRRTGDLPALLDEVAEVVRQRTEDRRQATSLTAQARASGAVLAALPVVFVALLSGAGGGGLGDFYRTPLGMLLLLAAGCCQGLGFLWMRRIVRGAETA